MPSDGIADSYIIQMDSLKGNSYKSSFLWKGVFNGWIDFHLLLFHQQSSKLQLKSFKAINKDRRILHCRGQIEVGLVLSFLYTDKVIQNDMMGPILKEQRAVSYACDIMIK